jgi:hypothetical protein
LYLGKVGALEVKVLVQEVLVELIQVLEEAVVAEALVDKFAKPQVVAELVDIQEPLEEEL